MTETARPYRTSALPPVSARILAFVAILIGGTCGGLIGWSVTDLQCGPAQRVEVEIEGDRSGAGTSPRSTTTPEGGDDDGCTTWAAVGGLVGAIAGAGGVGIVAVLVLRAMAEWRRNLDVEEPPLP